MRENLWFVIDKSLEEGVHARQAKVDMEVLRLLWNWSVQHGEQQKAIDEHWEDRNVRKYHGNLWVRRSGQDVVPRNGQTVRYAHLVKKFDYNPKLLSWVVFMEEQDVLGEGDVMVFDTDAGKEGNVDIWEHEMIWLKLDEPVPSAERISAEKINQMAAALRGNP